MSDADDSGAAPLPPPPPPLENMRLLALVTDLTALAEAHYRRLGELAAELRRLRDPVGPVWIAELGRTLDDYHRPAAALAQQVLAAGK